MSWQQIATFRQSYIINLLHFIEDTAKAKHIGSTGNFDLIIGCVRHLWGHITWCPASDEEIGSSIHLRRQSEVNQHTLFLPSLLVNAYHDVGGFDIPMHDTFRLQLYQSFKQLLHNDLVLMLHYLPRFKFGSKREREVLHFEVERPLGFEKVVEGDHVFRI